MGNIAEGVGGEIWGRVKQDSFIFFKIVMP